MNLHENLQSINYLIGDLLQFPRTIATTTYIESCLYVQTRGNVCISNVSMVRLFTYYFYKHISSVNNLYKTCLPVTPIKIDINPYLIPGK